MTSTPALKGGSPVRTRSWPRWPQWDEREVEALRQALEDPKWGIDSATVSRFEAQFAAHQGARFASAVTSGTTGLIVALQAAGIRAGDEVILPDYTFMASATAILAVGARPVFADIETETYNLDPSSVETVLTERTRGLMPVHFAGLPADLDRLISLAEKHQLAIVEDAAQAVGASWKGTPVGAIGTAGVFSFQSSKNLTSGEGGAVVTNSEETARRVDAYRNCGRGIGKTWYRYEVPGLNYRLTAFQAAILLVQLERAGEQFTRRERSARYLTDRLAEMPGLSPLRVPSNVTAHAYHLYVFRYDPDAFHGMPKQQFVEALRKEGIPASAGYQLPLHEQDFLTPEQLRPMLGLNFEVSLLDYSKVETPVTGRAVDREAVWLPQNVLLAEEGDLADVVEAIAKIQQNAPSVLE